MNNTSAIQIRNDHQHNDYEVLQDLIYREKGVRCSVLVTPHTVSIRVPTYADYLLAKSAISGRVSVPIIHDKS